MKSMIFRLAFLFLALGLVLEASAQWIPKLELYHGRDCPHCHQEIAWLPTLEAMYPGLEVDMKEVWYNPANQQVWHARMAELGTTPSGVPTNIIGDKVIVGFNREGILAAMEKNFGPPLAGDEVEVLSSEDTPWFMNFKLWLIGFLGLVIGTGAYFLAGRK